MARGPVGRETGQQKNVSIFFFLLFFLLLLVHLDAGGDGVAGRLAIFIDFSCFFFVVFIGFIQNESAVNQKHYHRVSTNYPEIAYGLSCYGEA